MYLRDRIYFGGRQVTNYLYWAFILRAWYDRRRPGAVETLGELLSNTTLRGKPFREIIAQCRAQKKNQINKSRFSK